VAVGGDHVEDDVFAGSERDLPAVVLVGPAVGVGVEDLLAREQEDGAVSLGRDPEQDRVGDVLPARRWAGRRSRSSR